MIITKKSLRRRTFLRGVGATLALPLLDGMVPALSAMRKTAARPVPRLFVGYVPNGVIMDRWTPTAEGTSFELPQTLTSLAPFRDQLTVVDRAGERPDVPVAERGYRRPRPRGFGVPHRCASQTDRGAGYPRRDLDRPDCREPDWTGDTL